MELRMGNRWEGFWRLVGILLATGGIGLAQPSITVESPASDAVFPEFSSPTLKVRVENGDGTLRFFADNPLNYDDLLLFTNVGANATYEVHLTNLPPGNYNIPVMTRGESDSYATNFIRFSVTNRWRSGPTFTAVILPGTNTTPTRINNLGQVVGASDGKAFLYDGEMHFLGTLGDAYIEATAINNKGQVVGVTYNDGGTRHAFLWDAQNGLQRLPIEGTPSDINDNGDIIGSVGPGFFLYRNGTMFSVSGPAWDISNDGIIAQDQYGIYDTRLGSRQVWNEFLRLHRRSGTFEVGTIRAMAINDAHEVAGTESASVDGARYPSVYAFRYRGYRRERITSPGTMASVQAINILGDIVGWSTAVTYGPRGTIVSETTPRAFIFARTGDSGINRLIANRGDLTVTKAFSINDRREIVGIGEINSETRGVLLRPLAQFQSIEFDAAADKIKANVEGFISMRVKIETSPNLTDWTFHSAQELTDAPLEITTPADGSAIYFRLTRD
jgi:probable HAF family extracellular repeat protein